jgi:very-short-patch-repair endonuclease
MSKSVADLIAAARERATDYGDPWPADDPIEPFAFATLGAPAAYMAAVALIAESPIEVQLGARLWRILPPPYELTPQFRLGRHRYDFAVTVDGMAILLIECDGRAFHSTAEQIVNDRRKDSVAKLAGIRILRFTGSEIFRNAASCADRVLHELGVA